MWKLPTVLLFGALVAQQVSAQAAQPNAMILAQAHDRCMATYAVRLTKTEAADEEIYSNATEGCKELKGQLHASIDREYPGQAEELITSLEAQAKPNFLQMLQKIRTDRQNRSSPQTSGAE